MQLQENFSLKKYNTFAIDAMAKYFAGFTTLEELEECLAMYTSFNIATNSTFVLGGGSNILFT
ncbi:MAG: UDP-N-acetylenolpyruvoylglucosamine reductase, partial [Gloeobacteraceae cyanobacterium ES-bin-316]|nr:UDP-N-acetylenolpyruvoylglucosamine reductase [Ferruginibacter sp.]